MPGPGAGRIVPVAQLAVLVARGDDPRAARPPDRRPEGRVVVCAVDAGGDLLLMPGPGVVLLVPVVQVVMAVGGGDDHRVAGPPDRWGPVGGAPGRGHLLLVPGRLGDVLV